MTSLMFVRLTKKHLGTGHATHSIERGQHQGAFPPFVSLKIAQSSGDTGYFLLRLCANSQAADTWHPTLQEAMDQVAFECGVLPDEWEKATEAQS